MAGLFDFLNPQGKSLLDPQIQDYRTKQQRAAVIQTLGQNLQNLAFGKPPGEPVQGPSQGELLQMQEYQRQRQQQDEQKVAYEGLFAKDGGQAGGGLLGPGAGPGGGGGVRGAAVPPQYTNPMMQGMPPGAPDVFKAMSPSEGPAAILGLKTGSGLPSNIQEWMAYQRLSPEQKDAYLTMKRANPYKDIGGSIVQPSPTTPGQIAGEIPKTVPPQDMPEFRGDQAAATTTATAEATASAVATDELAAAEASLPRLQASVIKLKELGKTATYTTSGRLRDAVRRETGMTTGPGAVARASYIAHVKNNVLPLLRDTFGAAFTAAEGDSLLATLGDPNMAPAEKEAVLDAFIADKTADLQTKRRRAGVAPQSTPPTDSGGGGDQRIDELLKKYGGD